MQKQRQTSISHDLVHSQMPIVAKTGLTAGSCVLSSKCDGGPTSWWTSRVHIHKKLESGVELRLKPRLSDNGVLAS